MPSLITKKKMSSLNKKHDIYMHRGQRKMYYSRARDQRLIAGRRWGKTQYLGAYTWEVADSMPRGMGAFCGSSRKQLFSRTVPGVIYALQSFYGFKEGVHFGWGRPPKWVPQPIMPLKNYDNILYFSNGYCLYCASLAVFGSVNSLTLNNITIDECKFIPYSKLNQEVMPALSGIVPPIPTKGFDNSNPFYKSTCFVSDASLSNKNNWLEKEEQKLDLTISSGPFEGKRYRELQDELFDYSERIDFYNEMLRKASAGKHRVRVVSKQEKDRIQTLALAMIGHKSPFSILPSQYKQMSKGMVDYCVSYKLISPSDAELVFDYEFLITPEQHYEMMQLKGSKKYARHINELRCNAFIVYRGSTLDNIDILTQSYIDRMRRDLSPLVFTISILNQKPKRLSDGFYANLDIENVHGYIVDDCPAIDNAYTVKTASHVRAGAIETRQYESLDFQYLGMKDDCTLDGDVIDGLPLHIALDYNAKINWIVTAQIYRRDGVEAMNVISSMFVKDGQMIQDLIRKWSHYYAPHRAKNNTVFYYYNHTAKMRVYSISGNADIKDTAIAELQRYGWGVEPVYMGQAMAHDMKYKNINEGLAGFCYPAIRFNRENNESLLIAMDNAGIRQVMGTFKKDKTAEKLSTDNLDGSSVPEELRTDGTDAFDDLYIGVRFFRNDLSGMCLPGGSASLRSS